MRTAEPHCTALHCTALHCTVLYCTALYSSAATLGSALHCRKLRPATLGTSLQHGRMESHCIADICFLFSFGNKILYPWGHTSEKTTDWRDLKEFANSANDAIVRHTASNRRIGRKMDYETEEDEEDHLNTCRLLQDYHP
jgi:hypothetical protein